MIQAKTVKFHIISDRLVKILLTLLDLSGLFKADRTGFTSKFFSHDDGTQSFSFSEMLLSSSSPPPQPPPPSTVNFQTGRENVELTYVFKGFLVIFFKMCILFVVTAIKSS